MSNNDSSNENSGVRVAICDMDGVHVQLAESPGGNVILTVATGSDAIQHLQRQAKAAAAILDKTADELSPSDMTERIGRSMGVGLRFGVGADEL